MLELLIVMTIIIVLAGLIIGTSDYVQKKGKRSRAEAEIAAMSAALESYKADNGIYPSEAIKTENVNPANATAAQRDTASSFVYGELSGDRDLNGATDSGAKGYMSFKPAMLQRADMSADVTASNKVTAIRDPFGNSYGYSTRKAANPSGSDGYNPTFDLWSTANSNDPAQWIKNW